MNTIGIGIIGLGFIGQTHARAVQALTARGVPCALTAVCDGDPARRSGRTAATGNYGDAGGEPIFDPDHVIVAPTPQALVDTPGVDLVLVCTWTDSHVELAAAALASGRHVLVEKPVSLRGDEVERLAAIARTSERLCVPAMCMRHWPAWPWLRDRVREGTYGEVRSAVFRRLGARPGWGNGFYADPLRCGGALFDLHIHDIDFIRWCFGPPDDTRSFGTRNHVTTALHYGAGPAHVIAEGGWSLAPSAGFRMNYMVCFEHATAEFDLARSTPLVVHAASGSTPVELSPHSAYELQLEAVVHALRSGDRSNVPTLDEAAAVTRLLERSAAMLDAGY